MTNSLLKTARKIVYSKDKVLLKIYNKLGIKLINEKDVIPNHMPFLKEKNILIDQHYLVFRLLLIYCM